MIEVGFIFPHREADGLYWSFSVFPNITIDYDESERRKMFEVSWLFWGIHITWFYE